MDIVKDSQTDSGFMPSTICSYATIYPLLATMFDYPDEGYLAKINSCHVCLSQDYPQAAHEIQAFHKRASKLTLAAQQEAYTRTFDMAPICCPYVSAYIYGEESFERGELMSRLSEAYQKVSFNTYGELPDHLGVLLRFTQYLNMNELEDLVSYCLGGAVNNMVERMKDNLFLPLMNAVQLVLAKDFPEISYQ